MADNMNDRVGHGGDPRKLEASDASNPWMVDNVSVFLNYCCPECDFKAKTLKLFSNHALENHEEALVLFEEELNMTIQILTKKIKWIVTLKLKKLGLT